MNRQQSLPQVPSDSFTNIAKSQQIPRNQINQEMSEFDLEESEFNNIDKNEQKEIYQFR